LAQTFGFEGAQASAPDALEVVFRHDGSPLRRLDRPRLLRARVMGFDACSIPQLSSLHLHVSRARFMTEAPGLAMPRP
jgi:hypothetical protein